jgi:hypothetical protein
MESAALRKLAVDFLPGMRPPISVRMLTRQPRSPNNWPGALHEATTIPPRWHAKLAWREKVGAMAARLFDRSLV